MYSAGFAEVTLFTTENSPPQKGGVNTVQVGFTRDTWKTGGK